MIRRLPPEPVVVIKPGDYSDPFREAQLAEQKAKAEYDMRQYDAAPPGIRHLWDAVGTQRLACQLWAAGVRDVTTAERVYRLMKEREASGYQ